MYLLTDKLVFPPAELADKDGLLAIGGDLSVERLTLAYQSGIFPWFSEGQPILWWSPDPRMVLFPAELKVSKSLRKTIRENTFRITCNCCFDRVIRQCATVKRKGQSGTWITPAMEEAYKRLHAVGRAISWEVFVGDRLVGGLYGVDLPERKIFCGESMFSKVSNASKVAFCSMVAHFKERGYQLIDCQQPTSHLASLGARTIDRKEFLKRLSTAPRQ